MPVLPASPLGPPILSPPLRTPKAPKALKGVMTAQSRYIQLATWLCGLTIGAATFAAAAWSIVIFVPVLGLIAFPSFVICLTVLGYAIPFMAYLLLAQTDPPSHVHGLFLPLNPGNEGFASRDLSGLLHGFSVRNLGLLVSIARYVDFLAQLLPTFAYSVLRHLLWEQLLKRLEATDGGRKKVLEESPRKRIGSGRTGGLFDDLVVFGVEYQKGSTGRSSKVDIYLAQPVVGRARGKSPTSSNSSPMPLGLAQDDRSKTRPYPKARSTSTTPAPQLDSPSTSPFVVRPTPPQSASSRSSERDLRPIVIFIYDLGTMGPIKPRRGLFCLLGIRLAELGYVVVIPDIGSYPPASAEDMVVELRKLLNWVNINVSEYGGDPTRLHLCGHGLGAHLAMFTLAQDAVVRSREERLYRGLGIRARDREDNVPNGLKALEIYGEEVEIPTIAGIILLSPIGDVIKQIRHESSFWLEHISPLRRALGPSQTMCMQNSLGHLLFAAKNVLQPERLPRKVLIIHGAQDRLVPLDSAHWLSELLYGLDVPTVFRPYRTLGHFDVLTSLMKGLEGEYTVWLLKDLSTFIGGIDG